MSPLLTCFSNLWSWDPYVGSQLCDPFWLHHVCHAPIILYYSIILYLYCYFCSQTPIPYSQGIHTHHLRYKQTEKFFTESSVSSWAKQCLCCVWILISIWAFLILCSPWLLCVVLFPHKLHSFKCRRFFVNVEKIHCSVEE